MTKAEKQILGWREWVAFPELGVEKIKAKIDTGAKTSSIHAYRIREIEQDGDAYLEFFLHPVQRRKKPEIKCRARLVDKRTVTSSNGSSQHRYVVETNLRIGEKAYPVELTLTDRDEMSFRVLIGREALRDRFVVDPGKSYQMGRSNRKGNSQ